MVERDDPAFAALLEYLKSSRGFDFTGYKQASLMRRVTRRMQKLGVETFGDYLDHLQVDPEEFVLLFNTILINVTGFFRDASTWEYLAAEIVPRILAGKGPEAPIRIWSAGCASGEEAYSLAMLLADQIGVQAVRDRVKIYATDVDEEALAKARQAAYSPREVHGVPAEKLDQYFESSGGQYHFNKEMRRSVIFGRHDLIQDAPISRIDLLVCRNTLMYFNADTQALILGRFHFALDDSGYLALGKAEMLLTHSGILAPVDLKRRVFTKVKQTNLRDRMLLVAQSGSVEAVNHLISQVRLRDAWFDKSPVAQVAIDPAGTLALTNERARRLFSLTSRDIGRPLQDIELSYRPAELRSLIEQAYSERRAVLLRDVQWTTSPVGVICLDIQVVPLQDASGSLLGGMISFDDVTRYQRLQAELTHTNEELETAYEELQSTNEELETTNEELQSSIEELETTNEELQSTNEELETTNEELQSTIEELQTINVQLRQRSDELDQANLFLNSILSSLRGGVAVLGTDLEVQIWNQKAEDLWGLRPDEAVGTHVLNLEIGLPVDRLARTLRASLSGDPALSEVTLDATNRRGKPIHCRVTSTPLTDAGGEIRGVILLMEDLDGA